MTRKLHLFPKSNWLKGLWFINLIAAAVFMVMMILVDAFPPQIVKYILIILFVWMVIEELLITARKRRWVRVIGVILSVMYITVFGLGSYYLYSTFSVFGRLDDNSTRAADGVDVTKDSYNVYLSGIDQWNIEKGKDLERSDVNMVATVNPITKTVLLTSIPRDAYVKLASSGEYDKLTHTGIYGVDETINTVEGWLDLNMNYYAKLNFSGVVEVINAIGGVDVYSPEEFVPEKRDTITIKKGWNHLTGGEALAFARERHSLKGGDEARVKNQQRVVKAIIRKLTTSSEALSSYPKLLDRIDKLVETNMSNREMMDIIKSEMLHMGGWKIKTQSVKGNYDMKPVASLSSANNYSVFITDEKSVKKCLNNIDKVMNPSEEEVNEILEKQYKDEQKSTLEHFAKKIVKKVKFW